ncbi:MAG: alpha/beta hydrolase [Clostridia bacterium]|nr:alpha/beta hydrolase [Clostridia bacterium]
MIFWIIGAVLLLVVAVAFVAMRWSYRKAFYFSDADKKIDTAASLAQVHDEIASPSMKLLAEDLESLPCEEITIRSHDGLTLFGRYYRFSDDPNRLEILFHGWRSNTFRDACGGARLARDAGYNLLVVDQRAHGRSDGNTITFGVKEKFDCLDWVNYAIGRFGPDVRILLGGISMGAATVLMASALPLPENVCGITADCGYSSPEAIIRKVCRDMKIPDRLGYPFVRLGARLFGRFSLDGESAVESVKHAKVPIMLMHGEADDFVPFSMAGEIWDAIASEKRMLTVPDAGHGLAYFYDTEHYTREVTAFKLACLDGKYDHP